MAKKIDVHVHVGEDLYRRYTPEMALERMDRNDIEFAVISPVPDYPTPYGIKSSAQQNDYIAAALQKYPDRFVRGLGVVNPRHGMAAVPEVDRIFGELGLSGLMFSNDKTGLTMDNPTMIAFFEHAMQYENPVVLSNTSQYSVLEAPFMLEKMARMFPGIRFINGSAFKDSTHANCSRFMSEIYDNIYADLANMNQMLNVLRSAINEGCLDKILFGSCIPFCDICPEIQNLENVPFTDEEKQKIYYDNAAKLFNL
jgi:predicted TIM-barrel fold metal-dependent hydrolase